MAVAAVGAAEVISVHSLEQWTMHIEEANTAKKPVVIGFTASWFGPCRIMAPVSANLAKKFPNAVFLKVDVDELKVMELMTLFTEYRGANSELCYLAE